MYFDVSHLDVDGLASIGSGINCDKEAKYERKADTTMTIRERTPPGEASSTVVPPLTRCVKQGHERRLLGKRKRITREQFLAMINTESPTNSTVMSPDSDSNQLYATFLDIYMPKSGGDQITFRSFLAVASSSKALSSAAKALALLLVGRATSDRRMLISASTFYSVALQRAYGEVASTETSKCITFGIALTLSEYDTVENTSLANYKTNSHGRYLLSFMEGCRIEDQTSDTLPKGLWQSHHRLVAALDALFDRTCPHSTKLLHREDKVRSIDEVAALADLTLCTTEILQIIDNLLSENSQPSRAAVHGILENGLRLERQHHTQMTTYYQSLRHLPYWFANPGLFAAPTCRGTQPLFRKVYDFVDITGAMVHVAYWMCLLALVETRLAISQSYPDMTEIDEIEILRLDKLRREYTDNICMSVPYLGETENGWAGRTTAMRPLHFLLCRFRQRCDWQKASWCIAMIKSLGVYSADDSKIEDVGELSNSSSQDI